MLDGLIGLVAPHFCVGCGREGLLLCGWCRPDALQPVPSRCFLCQKLTLDSATCPACRKKSHLERVWVATRLDGVARELVESLKFKNAKAGAKTIALLMDDALPHYENLLVTALPTVSHRRRQRGYDQAVLIAKHFAQLRGLEDVCLLDRVGKTRQVGANKAERWRQMEKAFLPRNSRKIAGRDILLIDDVLTTGASVSSAARTLKKAGARSVLAAVFAQKYR